ncbi:MAG TPA: type II toxin-antitoxin system HicB family antitoxin [Gaiellaceae bacterium]|jgi:predicted RNase H-like HicB family nuclease|nr:type II toxin-antitoxin system HicB family antitoxin [Gaiellaceae bacterium]
MTTRRFRVLLEWDAAAGAWLTLVPSLESLATYGDTRDDALDQTRDAILGYLEAAAKEGLLVPEVALQPDLVELEITASEL